jgi:hypothetical protein
MSTFHQSGFNFDGMYLSYTTVEGERKFVARFKTGGMASFRNFLIKNFSIQEYFTMMEDKDMGPLTILATKGYVTPRTAKLLKSLGYQPTVEGQKAYIQSQVNKIRSL